MPEPRDIPLVRWGEELRRNRAARRKARVRLAAAAVAGMVATATVSSLLWPLRPALVWNASESSPVGLYAVLPRNDLGLGDMVVAWPPSWARALALQRGYLAAGMPLVKRVAAVTGDHVCAAGEAVFVNGRIAALRRAADGRGRSLPWWTGCAELGPDQLLLIMTQSPASFDGRYFGPSSREDIVGEAKLLWAR